MAGNPLLNPAATLSGKALLQAATALANAQEQPTIQGLQGQINTNSQQTQNALGQVGGIYKGLGGQAQQSVGQEGQIAGGLNQQLAGIGQDEQQQLKGIGDSALQSLQRYAPEGSVAAPSLATEIARQQGLAAQNQGAFRSFGATQGANYQGFAGTQAGTFAKAGQEALRSIANAGELRNAPLSSRLASAISQRGALIGADTAKLRQQEISNGIAQAGLGVKQFAAQTTARNDATKNSLTLRGQNITSKFDQGRLDATIRGQNLAHIDRQDAIAVKQAALNLKSGSGGAKPLSTYQNDKTLGVLGKLQNAITVMQQQGITAGKNGLTVNGKHYKPGEVAIPHPNPAQIRQALSGVDPLGGPLTEAAFELLGYGAISPATARLLHVAGIRGGSFRNAPIKVGGQEAAPLNKAANTATQGATNAVNRVLSGL